MKKTILSFILGGIIFGCIGIYAANYLASDVTYTPKDTNWEVNNVNEALDDLYNSTDLKWYISEENAVTISPSGSTTITGLLGKPKIIIVRHTSTTSSNCTTSLLDNSNYYCDQAYAFYNPDTDSYVYSSGVIRNITDNSFEIASAWGYTMICTYAYVY